MSGEQVAAEYGGSAIRQMLDWPLQAAQDYWYYVVAGVVVLLLLWAYLRR